MELHLFFFLIRKAVTSYPDSVGGNLHLNVLILMVANKKCSECCQTSFLDTIQDHTTNSKSFHFLAYERDFMSL